MQISISIKKPLYRDYLRGMFKKTESGAYKVTREHVFGRFIVASVEYRKFPSKRIIDETTVLLDLPGCNALASAGKNFLYLSKESELHLNDQLSALFTIDFDRYCIQGEKLHMMKKDIVEAFIINRRIISLIGDNETLKKRHYRDELETQKNYARTLLNRAYHSNSRIEKELKTYNPLTVIEL